MKTNQGWAGLVALFVACASCGGGAGGEPGAKGLADKHAPAANDPYALDHPVPSSVHLGIVKSHLDNGLEILVNEDHSSPLVGIAVLYRVGSGDEEKGHFGLAHLVEHLMFDGSRHEGEKFAMERLSRAGAANMNAFTQEDCTVYRELVPSSSLELALWIEAERMGFHSEAVSQAEYERERRVVENELRQNYGEAPAGTTRKLIAEAMYPEGHPYHHLTIGEISDLDATTLEYERAFEKKYYVPNNATIVLTGDVKPADAKSLVAKYFAEIPAGNVQPRAPVAPVTLTNQKVIRVEADVERAIATVAWPLPARYASGIAELEVGEHSGFFSAGFEADSSLSHTYVDTNDQGGAMVIRVTAQPGKPPEGALADLDEQLHGVRARSDYVRFDRVKFAINRAALLTHTVAYLESFDERAVTVALDNFYTGDPGYVDTRLARYKAVRPRDIQDAAYQFLPFDGRIVVLVTPKKGAPHGGRIVGAL